MFSINNYFFDIVKDEGFFIAFYNDDSAVPSVTSNRYHAIVMFYTETNFHYSLEKVSRGGEFCLFLNVSLQGHHFMVII